MASNTVAGCREDDEGKSFSAVEQRLLDIKDKLESLSEKITLCDNVLNDLRDLSDVLVRKDLQHAPTPPET